MRESGHRVDEPLSSVGRLEVHRHEEAPSHSNRRATERLGFRIGLQQLDSDHTRCLLDDAGGVVDEAGILYGAEEQCSRVSPESYRAPRRPYELGMVSGRMGRAAGARAACHEKQAAPENYREESAGLAHLVAFGMAPVVMG